VIEQTQSNSNSRPVLDVPAAARFMGVSLWTLYDARWRRRHRVPAVRVGRLLKFREADLVAWLERHREV
jgi:excisionase family DNA binding protein